MQHIDAPALSSLSPRISYLTAFVGFTPSDALALHAAQPVVAALVPSVVDQVYRKLLSFDITAQSFVPRQTGYDGDAPAALRDLSLEHPQIKFRMDFLRAYLLKLATMDYGLESAWVCVSVRVLVLLLVVVVLIRCRSISIKSPSCIPAWPASRIGMSARSINR